MEEAVVTSNVPMRMLQAEVFEAVTDAGYAPVEGPPPLEQRSKTGIAVALYLTIHIIKDAVEFATTVERAGQLARKIGALIRRKAPDAEGKSG